MNCKDIYILGSKIKEGYQINSAEAYQLTQTEDKEALYALACDLRKHFNGNKFESCSIINAKSGRCPEDCKWCSQSTFHSTKIDVYPLIKESEALDMALHNRSKGVERFSLVTSGRKLSTKETMLTADIYSSLKEKSDIKLCASLGLMSKEKLEVLYKSGVTRYHCNIESAPSHFNTLCTTHTLEDKLATLRAAREVGMELCSGGIIGMGESMEQRIEFAMTLREIAPDSIPLNILSPIPGTPLENMPPLSQEEILASIAIIKIVNPAIPLRFAGGRGALSSAGVTKALHSGISGAIVGDMLTTAGATDINSDFKRATEEGFHL